MTRGEKEQAFWSALIKRLDETQSPQSPLRRRKTPPAENSMEFSIKNSRLEAGCSSRRDGLASISSSSADPPRRHILGCFSSNAKKSSKSWVWVGSVGMRSAAMLCSGSTRTQCNKRTGRIRSTGWCRRWKVSIRPSDRASSLSTLRIGNPDGRAVSREVGIRARRA